MSMSTPALALATLMGVTEKATVKVAIDESLSDKRQRITSSFLDIYWPASMRSSNSYGADVGYIAPPLYVVDVYDSYLVIERTNDWGKYYKVAYTDAADGATFAAMSEWTPVSAVHGWVERSKEFREAFTAAEKEGRRHSTTDQQHLQSIHDAAKSLGAECMPDEGKSASTDDAGGFVVFKDVATGRQRWVSVSASAYEDRDKETITLKALAADVDRADADGDYGPLLWWHEKSMPLGSCDFNAMEGRMLVESGLFDDEEVGKAFSTTDESLGLSIGFKHPASEPLADGTYHTIIRKERSLLPIDKSSNKVAWLVAIEKEDKTVDKDKEARLRKILGPAADAVLGKVKAVDDAAAEAGLTHKAQGGANAGAGAQQTAAAAVAAAKPASAAADDKTPAAEAAPDPLARKLSDITVKEFAEAMGLALAPLSTKLDALSTDKTKAASDMTEVKEGVVMLAEAMGERLKETDDKLSTLLGDVPKGLQRAPVWRGSQQGAASTVKSAAGVGDGAGGPATLPVPSDQPWLALVDAMDGRPIHQPQTPLG